MCDFSQNLVAWFDQELPAEETARVERHLVACADCQSSVERYRQLSDTIDAYCYAAIAATPARRSNRRIRRPVLAGASALAAVAATLLLLLRLASQSLPPAAPPGSVPAIALQKTPFHAIAEKTRTSEIPFSQTSSSARTPSPSQRKSVQPTQRSASSSSLLARNENWLPNQTPVFIAIPADALFPPGALPEGVGFVADVNWRPDGSAQRLRLRPQLIGLERKSNPQ